MTLTITLDDKYRAAFDRRASATETAESIAAAAVVERMAGFLAIDLADAKAALADNEALMQVGFEVAAATPEKQAAAIAAARQVLNA